MCNVSTSRTGARMTLAPWDITAPATPPDQGDRYAEYEWVNTNIRPITDAHYAGLHDGTPDPQCPRCHK